MCVIQYTKYHIMLWKYTNWQLVIIIYKSKTLIKYEHEIINMFKKYGLLYVSFTSIDYLS